MYSQSGTPSSQRAGADRERCFRLNNGGPNTIVVPGGYAFMAKRTKWIQDRIIAILALALLMVPSVQPWRAQLSLGTRAWADPTSMADNHRGGAAGNIRARNRRAPDPIAHLLSQLFSPNKPARRKFARPVVRRQAPPKSQVDRSFRPDVVVASGLTAEELQKLGSRGIRLIET